MGRHHPQRSADDINRAKRRPSILAGRHWRRCHHGPCPTSGDCTAADQATTDGVGLFAIPLPLSEEGVFPSPFFLKAGYVKPIALRFLRCSPVCLAVSLAWGRWTADGHRRV